MLYVTHRYVADKLPFHKDTSPSSLTILCAACHMPLYFAAFPVPVCNWNLILRRSNGADTTRAKAPANAPANTKSSNLDFGGGVIEALVATTEEVLRYVTFPIGRTIE
jgi:hypothetical protein